MYINRSRTQIKYVTKYVQRKECGYVLFRVFSMFRKKTTEELVIKLMIKVPLSNTPLKSNNRLKSIALPVLDNNFTVI